MAALRRSPGGKDEVRDEVLAAAAHARRDWCSARPRAHWPRYPASVTGDDGNPVALTPGAPLTLRNMECQGVRAPRRGRQRVVAGHGRWIRPASAPTRAPRTAGTRDHQRGQHFVILARQRHLHGERQPFTDRELRDAEGRTTSTTAVDRSARPSRSGAARRHCAHAPARTRSRRSRSCSASPPIPAPARTRSVRQGRRRRRPTAHLRRRQETAFLDTRDRQDRAQSSARAPGDYVVVARAQSGDYYTAWSAPVTLKLIAPFDFMTRTFPDSRGPRYQVRAHPARGERRRRA